MFLPPAGLQIEYEVHIFGGMDAETDNAELTRRIQEWYRPFRETARTAESTTRFPKFSRAKLLRRQARN